MSPQLYTFKVAFKHNKRIWRRIEILEDQTLDQFDTIIRKSFNHDLCDHLSEFSKGKGVNAVYYGTIRPDGKGEGSHKKVKELNLSVGEQAEYVYDFGDNIQHIITLEEISDVVEEVIKYPRLIAQNKPKHYYCLECEKEGKRVIATNLCAECSDNNQQKYYVCDRHVEPHYDHGVEELVY